MESAAGMQSETHIEVEAGRRASRTADLVATIVGLLLLVPGVLFLAYMGIWVRAVTGQCGDFNVCNDAAVAAGMGTAMFGPLVVWVVALVASIVFLAVRRTAWWIPPVAFLMAIVVLNAGAGLAHWGANLL